MRHLLLTIAFASAVAALIGSCDEQNQPTCIPEQASDCFCQTGERGTMTCEPDGHEYGRCLCTPDAGSDAGVDAAIDAN